MSLRMAILWQALKVRIISFVGRSSWTRLGFWGSLTALFLFIGVEHDWRGYLAAIIYGAAGLYEVVSTRRVNNTVLAKHFGRVLVMNVADASRYTRYSYVTQTKEVAALFKAELVEAFTIAASWGRPVRLKTHEWVLRSVIEDPQVASLFRVDVRRTGQWNWKKFARAICAIVSWREIWQLHPDLRRRLTRHREIIEVTLTPIKASGPRTQ